MCHGIQLQLENGDTNVLKKKEKKTPISQQASLFREVTLLCCANLAA